MRTLWKALDRKAGEMTQERFNMIMYVIIGMVLFIGIAAATPRALDVMYDRYYTAPPQVEQIDVIVANSKE